MTTALAHQPRLLTALAEAWRYRDLLRNLVVWSLKVKYQRSLLGFVWTLLNPLLIVATLTAVFGFVIRVGIPHFWAFLLSGYFVWNTVQQSLFAGTFVLAEHASLRRSVAFPSEVLVFGAALSRLAEFLLELLLLVVVLSLLHLHRVPLAVLVLPALVVPMLLLTAGLMLPLATVSAFYRDTQHILPVVLGALFYMTPVFYRVDMVPAALLPWYVLNPFAGLLEMFHAVLYDGVFPSGSTYALTTVEALAVFLAGYALFNRTKSVAAEIV